MIPAADVFAVEELLASYEHKREHLAETVAVLEKQLAALDEIISGLRAARAGMEGCPREGTGDEQKTNYERIVEFLDSVGNQPQSIGQLEAGTAVPKSSISAVLYRTHPDKFIVTEGTGKQPNQWRLKGWRFVTNGDEAAPVNSGEEIPF